MELPLRKTFKFKMKAQDEKKEMKAGESLQLETLFGLKNSKAMSSDRLGGIEKHKLQNRKSTLGWLSKNQELVKI